MNLNNYLYKRALSEGLRVVVIRKMRKVIGGVSPVGALAFAFVLGKFPLNNANIIKVSREQQRPEGDIPPGYRSKFSRFSGFSTTLPFLRGSFHPIQSINGTAKAATTREGSRFATLILRSSSKFTPIPMMRMPPTAVIWAMISFNMSC